MKKIILAAMAVAFSAGVAHAETFHADGGHARDYGTFISETTNERGVTTRITWSPDWYGNIAGFTLDTEAGTITQSGEARTSQVYYDDNGGQQSRAWYSERSYSEDVIDQHGTAHFSENYIFDTNSNMIFRRDTLQPFSVPTITNILGR